MSVVKRVDTHLCSELCREVLVPDARFLASLLDGQCRVEWALLQDVEESGYPVGDRLPVLADFGPGLPEDLGPPLIDLPAHPVPFRMVLRRSVNFMATCPKTVLANSFC